jgi:hypothetical protein
MQPQMARLTAEARVLARELLRWHEQICQQFTVSTAEDVTAGMIDQSVIRYGVLCERAGVPFLTHGVGLFLGEIAEWCAENGWPPLNALAVNSETGMPGDGYDGAAGCSLLTWPDEVKRCIAFDRYPTAASL